MNVYESDQEQVEALKNWWKKNGKLTVAVVIIAIAVSFGWRYWQQYRIQRSEQASMLYEQMLNAFTTQQTPQAKQVIDTLKQDYKDTPYADIAALFAAKSAVEQNQLNDAMPQLQWVIKNGGSHDLRQLARLRAARILLAQKQPQQTLAMLDKVDDSAYMPAIDLVKGDAYVALGQNNNAKKSYQDVLSKLPATELIQPLVQMKLNQLG